MSHLNDLAAEYDQAAATERAHDRAGAYIPDDPRRPSVGAEEPDSDAPWWRWRCLRCDARHRDGDPLTDRCECGYLLGESA